MADSDNRSIPGTLRVDFRTSLRLCPVTITIWPCVPTAPFGRGATITAANSAMAPSPATVLPMQVPGLTGITSLAARYHTSFAVKGTAVYGGWGKNDSGQLGLGDTTNRSTPGSFLEPRRGEGYFRGLFPRTVGLMADGTVRAWGANANGQLGNGTTTANSSTSGHGHRLTFCQSGRGGEFPQSRPASRRHRASVGLQRRRPTGQRDNDPTAAIPVTVTGLTNVKGIAGGAYHSLALLADGTVRAWGNNGGQLGNGTHDPSSTPVTVTGLTNVKAVAAVGYYSLALLADGTVQAWGVQRRWPTRQRSTNTHSMTPVTVTGLTNVKAIAAGAYSQPRVARRRHRAGLGIQRLRPIGKWHEHATARHPVTVTGLHNVVKISAGVLSQLGPQGRWHPLDLGAQ